MNRTPMSQSYVNSQAGQQQQQQQQSSQQQQQQQSGGNNPSAGQSTQPGNTTMDSNTANSQGNQMQQLKNATELTNLLLEFAFSVFVNKPQDIVEFAATYFNQLHRGQQQQRSYPSSSSTTAASAQQSNEPASTQQQQHHRHNQQQTSQQALFNSNKRTSSDSQRSNSSSINGNQFGLNSGQNSDYQDEDSMDDFDGDPRNKCVNFAPGLNTHNTTSFSRRKSVFAEQYDPAADQEDDENCKVVHSKSDEQRQRLAKSIQSIFIFRSLDSQDMQDILDAMFEVKVTAGDMVIRQGDDGDNFYVVEQGKFQIYVINDDGSKDVRGEYENSGSFGELALMYNQPRAATVVALTDGSLWAMDRNTFRKIVLKRAYKKRKDFEALFERVTVLQGLNGYERMNLCDALVSQRFSNGQTIIVQGDIANGMYFIESGNVKIVKKLEDGSVMELAILGKGDYFGELALIEHKPRAASVYAIGDNVKLAFLDVRAFERLLGSCIDRMEKNCAMYFSELAQNENRQNV